MNARVFAALELPPDVRQALSGVIAGFRESLPQGCVRWVRAERVHLTLKFYGEVRPDRLADIQAFLTRAADKAGPISLAVEGLGVFPNPIRPQVIWTGVTGDLSALRALQKAVEDGATALGFESEARPYSPHLTLGRVNERLRPAERQTLAQFLAQTRVARLGEFRAETLNLMRSELRPGGSVYTRLFAAPLGSRYEHHAAPALANPADGPEAA